MQRKIRKISFAPPADKLDFFYYLLFITDNYDDLSELLKRYIFFEEFILVHVYMYSSDDFEL